MVSSIEYNHKSVESARKGQEVCIKIDAVPGEAPKMFGRHFEAKDFLVSKVSVSSIVFRYRERERERLNPTSRTQRWTLSIFPSDRYERPELARAESDLFSCRVMEGRFDGACN